MTSNRYLCFDLGPDEFAIPLLSVREVLAMPEITPIPQSPAHFLGIMNLRGLVISIMDLRQKMGLKPQAHEETTVVILDFEECRLGVVVDRVNSVQSFTEEEIKEKPRVDAGKALDPLNGVVRRNEKLILLLDVAKVLSIDDRFTMTQQIQTKGA